PEPAPLLRDRVPEQPHAGDLLAQIAGDRIGLHDLVLPGDHLGAHEIPGGGEDVGEVVVADLAHRGHGRRIAARGHGGGLSVGHWITPAARRSSSSSSVTPSGTSVSSVCCPSAGTSPITSSTSR